jgi:hypothetical protein
MPKFIDADSSINEMLELLKNYRTDGKSRDCSELHFESKFHSIQGEDFSSTLQFSSRHDDKLIGLYKLSASLEKTLPGRDQLSTIRQRPEPKADSPQSSIFNRLYEEVSLVLCRTAHCGSGGNGCCRRAGSPSRRRSESSAPSARRLDWAG